MIRRLAIKVGDADSPVATLSGGNQQKVVIAKWLMTEAHMVLLNDPTRGIDVGTKEEIYQLLRVLADAGTALLFYTTYFGDPVDCCVCVSFINVGRIQWHTASAPSTHAATLRTRPNNQHRPYGTPPR